MTFISSEKMAGVFTKNVFGFLTIDKSWEQRRTGDGNGEGNQNVKRNEPNIN